MPFNNRVTSLHQLLLIDLMMGSAHSHAPQWGEIISKENILILYIKLQSLDVFFNISILFFSECFVFISKKRLQEWSFRKNANPLCTLMEPFGLGHVVNERFALEVRKVHGQGREGRIQNWALKILKSKLQFHTVENIWKKPWICEKFSKSFICYRLLRLEIVQHKNLHKEFDPIMVRKEGGKL